MAKRNLLILGFAALVVGAVFLVGGLIAAIYSYVSSTPDPPFFYGTIYPYARFSAMLLGIGFLSLAIGAILFIIYHRSKKPI